MSSIRRLKRTYHIREEPRQTDENKAIGSLEKGKLVIINMKPVRTTGSSWEIGELKENTPDNTSWKIQWYNTEEQQPIVGKINASYAPCWLNDGKEIRTFKPPKDAEALEWTVHSHRFSSEGFELTRHNKLPAYIKASIRTAYKGDGKSSNE